MPPLDSFFRHGGYSITFTAAAGPMITCTMLLDGLYYLGSGNTAEAAMLGALCAAQKEAETECPQ